MKNTDDNLQKGLDFIVNICVDMNSELISLKDRVKQIEMLLRDDGK